MKRFKNILIAVVLAAMLLAMPSGAAGDENCDFGELGLDGVMRQYMSEHGLNEENFAMGWYDLKTGDSWYCGENRFMVGGSMYKLPLNMALSDLIAAGEIEDTDDIELLRMASIVYSDNEAALDHAKRACSMEPGNMFYRQLLAQIEQGSQAYENYGNGFGFNTTTVRDNGMCSSFCLPTLLCSMCGGGVPFCFCC